LHLCEYLLLTMNDEITQKALSTAKGNQYFDWFKSTYEVAFENLAQKRGVTESIRLFDIRLTAAIGTEILVNENFRYAKLEEEKEAYALMLKLSNIWFSYEALMHACEKEGLLKNPKSKIDALGDDTLTKLTQEYEFFNVQLDFWGMSGRIKGNSAHTLDLQEYIDHLTRSATSKEQQTTLKDVYNRFTNNDFFSIKEALAFAYAVRNQYVHAGEAPNSGVKYISTKIIVLRTSFDFLVLLCLRLGELLMDGRAHRIAPPTASAS
jgi:hypothetical protein